MSMLETVFCSMETH